VKNRQVGVPLTKLYVLIIENEERKLSRTGRSVKYILIILSFTKGLLHVKERFGCENVRLVIEDYEISKSNSKNHCYYQPVDFTLRKLIISSAMDTELLLT